MTSYHKPSVVDLGQDPVFPEEYSPLGSISSIGETRDHSPHAKVTARLLEGLLVAQDPYQKPGSSLTNALRHNRGQSLKQAYRSLDPEQKNRFASALGPANVNRLLMLSQESHGEFFYRGLVGMAGQLRNQGKTAESAYLYSALEEVIPQEFASLKKQSHENFLALQGKGSVGARLEILTDQFMDTVMDPYMLASMGAAQLTFGVARWGLMSKIPQAWISHPLARIAAANLGAFALEGVSFVGTHRGLAHAFGQELPVGGPSVFQELGHIYLTLGLLKGLGGTAGAALKRYSHGAEAVTLTEKISRVALPQGAMYLGIYSSNALAPTLGLGEVVEHNGMESLVTLFHFGLAGGILNRIPHFKKFNQKIQIQTEVAARDLASRGGKWLADTFRLPPLGPQSALAAVGPALPKVAGPRPTLKNWAQEVFGKISIFKTERKTPTLAPEIVSDSDRPGSTSDIPISDMPSREPALKRATGAWAHQQGFGSSGFQAMEKFMTRFWGEMWNTLNMRSESPEARALAMGRPLTLRIETLDGSPDRYQMKLFANPKMPYTHESQVQWTFDPSQGSLTPQEYVGHASFKIKARESGVDISHGFLAFFTNLRITTEGLKPDSLVKALPEGVRQLVLMEPTLHWQDSDRMVTEPKLSRFKGHPDPRGPTILEAYFPLIKEGVRQSIDAYANEMGMPDKGRARLQKLIATALDAQRLKESQDPALGDLATWYFIMSPSPLGRGRRVAALTPNEAYQRPFGPKDIVLPLNRGFGGNPPMIIHQWIDTPKRNGTQTDLKFQQDLGLAEPLRLEVPHLTLYPSEQEFQSWDHWMSQYYKG